MEIEKNEKQIARPLPITARALTNALGATTQEVLDQLFAGCGGLMHSSSLPSELKPLPFETFVGVVPGELPPLPQSEKAFDSRLARIALRPLLEMSGAIRAAVARWGSRRVALVIGTSTGGILETEAAFDAHLKRGSLPESFDFERQHAFHGLVELVARRFDLGGPAFALSTACSSSGKVFGSAQRLIESGLADAVLVGGADSLCQTTLRGFRSLGVLSSELCRPFSREREGLNIGEGAAFLLLEREAEADLALLGVGESSDAHHMSHPHPEGEGALSAMLQALERAGVSPEGVDHINAHGTGTRANDASEAKAISALFGNRVPIASTKGYTGHLLGAGGATEAIFACASIERGRVPASLGADPVDPELLVNVSSSPRDRSCRRVLSNSFAFGGSNVSALFGALPRQAR